MNQGNDIEKIREILKHWGRYDLAGLLKFSTSKINESSRYGSYPLVIA